MVSELPNTNIHSEQAVANRHMQIVIKSLLKYSQDSCAIFDSEEKAIEALIVFLSDFSIDCLKTYIFGTALPEIPVRNTKALVLISNSN